MLQIANYVRAQSLEEAYTLYQKKNSTVIAGMLWTKMSSNPIGTGIDLCDLGLDKIEETEDAYRIGAMVSLRALETHAGIDALTQGAMRESLRHIVGVQFRNVATVGGSIYGRFGFSDVLTMFQVLNAKVELYKHGVMPIREFAVLPRQERDILVRIILPKAPMQIAYLSQRNTATDFPSLTCAVSLQAGKILCAIGARPGRAVVFEDETGLLKDGIHEASANAFGQYVAERATFQDNIRGSAAYRQKICAVLVRRALLQLEV